MPDNGNEIGSKRLLLQPFLFEEPVRRVPAVPRFPPGESKGEEKSRACESEIPDEAALAALTIALGAEQLGPLARAEKSLLANAPQIDKALTLRLRQGIESGGDPLGDAFCAIRSAAERRRSGAVFTPHKIVSAMVDWAETVGVPQRVVEPGAGSAPFLMEAARRFPDARLIAVENDPLASLLARANLNVAGYSKRSEIILDDFRIVQIAPIEGRTLYIGNPPYVRHHLISEEWKKWLRQEAAELGLKSSTLAGLHVHFFLAIARWAKAGDYGALITASEWLDVNYGQLVRDLFLTRLGGQSVYVIEPNAEPFPGTASTAAVTSFTVNGKPQTARFARIRKLDELHDLTGGHIVDRERLTAEQRWSHFTGRRKNTPGDHIELGELCRVHRGQVTGANRVWIAGAHSQGLPNRTLYPTVTKAMELIKVGQTLTDASALRRVIDLPVDLSVFDEDVRAAIDGFLVRAEQMGAKDSYIARTRKAWWSVGLREPAPILATYMARRPPSFVLNEAAASHLNIAHGLYPREPLSEEMLLALVCYLRGSSSMEGGRVYSGGLTKFEPREMERIPIPRPEVLAEMAG